MKFCVEHIGLASFRYALNETNALIASTQFSVFDDQAVEDANSDRKRLRAILDMDHDLTPTWILFGGYGFQDTAITGEKTKSSQVHSARLGVRHDLGEPEKERLEATLLLQRSEFHVGTTATDLGFTGSWTHELGPRTRFKLSYADTHDTSFSAGRLRYRDQAPTFEIFYQLTPLLDLKGSATYSKQTSSSKDVIIGSSGTSETNKLCNLLAELKWQIREQTRAWLGYTYGRSTTRDYTYHEVELKLETTF